MKKLLLAASMLVLSAGVQAAQDPEAVFNRSCGVCHNGQLPMAPKKGDAAAWEPRLKQGMDTLVQHVTNGFNAMPKRGGNPDLTDAELERAIAYMANSAGGKFTEPPVLAASDAASASAPAAATG